MKQPQMEVMRTICGEVRYVQMTCPICKRFLRKCSMTETLCCWCGWIWR
jgi:hypothetical protein